MAITPCVDGPIDRYLKTTGAGLDVLKQALAHNEVWAVNLLAADRIYAAVLAAGETVEGLAIELRPK